MKPELLHISLCQETTKQTRTCVFLHAEFMLKVTINTSLLGEKKLILFHLRNWDELKDVNELWGME